MRIKTGITRHRRHRKIKKQASGFRGNRRRSVRGAKEGIMHALAYAYVGRKLKKRSMRRLWIIRLNAAVRSQGLSYSKFMHILKDKQVGLNRNVLAEIAYQDTETMDKIVRQLK